uniref:Laminin EGF-like domain-containing protein n=1 Tax=Neogobius melanostomus TaxID=47308 RepID=A0A8C6TAI1_9GOBI
MRRTSLIMYISAALLVILHVYSGFSEAAPPRINQYDASPSTTIATSSSSASPPPRTGIISTGTGVRKRSTDAQSTLFAPEKTLQTMVSPMVSQRSANDAWSAYSTGSVAAIDASQELVCNCSTGAEGILDPDECDPKTGQCTCEMGYTGLQCDDCEESYFTNGTSGCLPCACDSYGAISHLCDSSGTCVCKAGVYGPKCDDCHPGFFHFSSTGCRPCQCNNHTSNCHPQSGVCLNCEGNTQGSNCEECRPGYYHRPSSGLSEACAPCPCSNTTSTGTCHTDAGGSPVCDRCLAPYSGPRCDQCSAGFFKRDNICVPCDCSGNSDPQGRPRSAIRKRDTVSAAPTTPRAHTASSVLRDTRETPGRTTARSQCPGLPRHQPRPPPPAPRKRPHHPRPAPPLSPSRPPLLPPKRCPLHLQLLLCPRPDHHAGPSDQPGQPHGQHHGRTHRSLLDPVQHHHIGGHHFSGAAAARVRGGVYTYREYQNRKLNAPFWTIELKEDNISFSSYHDSIPNADVSGLLEDEANEVAPNGQLALTTQGNCYKA